MPEHFGDFDALLEKYQALLTENGHLKEEIRNLRAKLGILEPAVPSCDIPSIEPNSQEIVQEPADEILPTGITNFSPTQEKIGLFMSLFKGRDDVFAVRWENEKKGEAGYSPFCLNKWKPGLCRIKKGGCVRCPHKTYARLDEGIIDDHLRGNMVLGIYPMLLDETCWFLAIDFDKGEWQEDIVALREACVEFEIPLAVERSRSGNGCHAWFFFERPLSTGLARKFGTGLLTAATGKRHEINFKSYDRFCPGQDIMPKGGLGNLIALPLQKEARKAGNSEFIDPDFNAYADQWAFLASIQRLSESDLEALTARLCRGNELGALRIDEEETQKPWETVKIKLLKKDFSKEVEIVKANMLYVPKSGISQRALDRLKRLAAFKNPEFYKAQAMRMSTRGKSRIICCADDIDEYLCLPRGCEEELKAFFSEHGVDVNYVDKTNGGKEIDVTFNGGLRDEQPLALERLVEHDIGVLAGTTAFGKTVVAIKLLAKREVNTLIIVNRVGLISQWKKRLTEFLTINETLPDIGGGKKRGRKKIRTVIGQLGGGKENLSGIIDIALMQSLNRQGEVKDCVKDYGMIIVDECHHVAAFSFETILKTANARYVCGLTATPARKDGHHPIIFMLCGPVRYRDDARRQADKRPFDHFVIPRFTPLRAPLDKDETDVSIQDLYAEIAGNGLRNQLIVDDVVKNHENGRNSLVLTERVSHVKLIAAKLREKIPDVISLTGGMGARETGEILKRITETPADRQLTLVATGRFVGEGFDEPRLDTLFLTMPISWRGTLQQYAGRLHRLFENKKEVLIYDYVDIHVGKLERMYNKRLNGYASIGYKARGEVSATDSIDIIFDKSNFLPVYSNDIVSAEREVLIVSPFVTLRRTRQMMQHLEAALRRKVKVIVVTRPLEDFGEKDTASLQGALKLLQDAGVNMIFRTNIHQKFAVVDQRISWYGSINLLSFGSSEESIMRLESPNIANELIKSLERK